MSDEEADALIDAQLRNVPVPPELAVRLRAIVEWPDEEIDRDLSLIDVPKLLADRLKEIPAHAPLDVQLASVPTPGDLRRKLRNIAAGSHRWQQLGMKALAASLLLAIGCGYAAFAWQLLLVARLQDDRVPFTFAIMQPAPHELNVGLLETEVDLIPMASETVALPPDSEFVNVVPDQPWTGPFTPRPLAPVEQLLAADQASKLYRPVTVPVLGDVPVPNELPPLDLVQLPQPRGVLTPLVRGYNRGFLLRTGVYPPVSPVVLQQSLAPLSFATDSFDEVRSLASAKKRIPADRVRTEDFIAAVDHQLAWPAPGELSLSVVGSDSPYGPDATRLLGLGVKAGESARRVRPATHLVIAIDFSAGLGKSGAWNWVRDAVAEAVARLGSDDRISLVFFQDEVLMASSPLASTDASLLRQRLLGTSPYGEVDPAVGLEAALDLALAAESPAKTTRIAVLSEGHFELSHPQRKRLQRASDQARQGNVELDLIQLGAERSPAAGIAALAQSMRVARRPLDTRRKLVQGISNLVRGDEAIVASETRLLVRFVPEAVAAYRLIGHEANAMAQLVPPAEVVDLRAGDEALVLFELLPGGSNVETVAEVELTWLDPVAGQRRSLRQPVGRSQLMQPWASASPAFRAATIAAEAAEYLRGSRSALRELKWARGDKTELTSLVQQTKALRSSAGDTSFQALSSLVESLAQAPEQRK